MANVIRHKRGTSDPSASDFSQTGELLVNTTDGGLFTKDDSNNVVEVGTNIPVLSVGAGTDTNSSIHIGDNSQGDSAAFIDLVGDTTYTGYGLRLIRSNAGENAASSLQHRGTGNFNISANQAAPIYLKNSGTSRLKVKTNGDILITGKLDINNGLDVTGDITVTWTVDGVDVAALAATVASGGGGGGGGGSTDLLEIMLFT